MKKTQNKYYLYILKCKDKTLYCGIAKDVARRSLMHNAGKGSAYVRSRGGGIIVYTEAHKNKGLALKREALIKSWTKTQKLNLIQSKKIKVAGKFLATSNVRSWSEIYPFIF